MSWRQAPDQRRHWDPPTGKVWVLATLPVLIHTRDLQDEAGWLLGWALPIATVTGMLLLIGRHRPRWFPGAAAGGLVAAVVWMGTGAGLKLAPLVVIGAVIWGIGSGVVPIAPARLHEGRAWRPALAAVVIGDVLLVFGPNLRVPAVAMLIGTALAVSGTLRPDAMASLSARLEQRASPLLVALNRLARIVKDIATLVGRGLVMAFMAPVALVVTVLWAVQRLVGRNPLASPSGRDTAWVKRLGSDPHPDRFYGSAATEDRRSPLARASGIASALATLGLCCAAALFFTDDGDAPLSSPTVTTEVATPAAESGPCPSPPPNPVLDEQANYRVLECERSRAFAHGEFSAPAIYRMSDFSGSTLNVRDGVRRTWRAPDCDCRRLQVWWFGGSAAWGEGQEDSRTVPSQLAKEAWRNGIALDITNFAMPTYTISQEVHLFAELTTRMDPPDLVLFYDGGNDLIFQALRTLRGRADDESDIVLAEQVLDDLFSQGIPVSPEDTRWTPQPEELGGALSEDDAPNLARRAMARYLRNVGLAERLAASIDRPVRVAWQPLLADYPVDAGPPDAIPEGLLAAFGAMVTEARAQLPSGVLDLGDALEGADRPAFYDLFHTGEYGAQLVAAELWTRLEPDVRTALADARCRARPDC